MLNLTDLFYYINYFLYICKQNNSHGDKNFKKTSETKKNSQFN